MVAYPLYSVCIPAATTASLRAQALSLSLSLPLCFPCVRRCTLLQSLRKVRPDALAKLPRFRESGEFVSCIVRLASNLVNLENFITRVVLNFGDMLLNVRRANVKNSLFENVARWHVNPQEKTRRRHRTDQSTG